MNECMACWEALLPHTVRHPTITRRSARACCSYYQSKYAGAMYSGCGGGYLYVVSESPSPARSASPSASPRRVERVETVVVSGSFDDLRSAHVRLLQEAARGGPVHVLLWSDAAIERLEGRRPKFPQDERRYLLESIRYVDRVTICPCPFGPEPPPSWATPPAAWIIDPLGRPAEQAAYCRTHGLRIRTIEKEDLAGFPDEPPEAVDSPTARKRVIVTGCYDWFHSGHVRFFEEASALGDLYVVVGHDANIRLLKGEGHPLFPQEERRYLAQAVRFVTQALVATGDGWLDAEPEIERLRPDIYAVNEDGDRPEKREYCESHGIEYRVLKRTPKEGLPRRQSTDLRGF